MKLLVFILLASVWMGCQQHSDASFEQLQDSFHTLSKERFDNFSDSMHSNMNKSLEFMVTRQHDSALFYSGKQVAYFEMETKELHK